MFDRIAANYDAMNWVISLGQTTLWRLLALWKLRMKRSPLPAPQLTC
jgi:ubiquinone/menaquinone biosynthesis C-methylase UbiE